MKANLGCPINKKFLHCHGLNSHYPASGVAMLAQWCSIAKMPPPSPPPLSSSHLFLRITALGTFRSKGKSIVHLFKWRISQKFNRNFSLIKGRYFEGSPKEAVRIGRWWDDAMSLHMWKAWKTNVLCWLLQC